MSVVRVAGEFCPVIFLPVLNVACNAWSLGPHVNRCPLCAAAARPELAHLFVCDGLFGLCRDVWPRAAWPRHPHGWIRAISVVGALSDRSHGQIRAVSRVGLLTNRWCLRALAIDAAWSSPVAGAARPGSAVGAFQARMRGVALRLGSAARVHNVFR